jgi:hypothetical protein
MRLSIVSAATLLLVCFLAQGALAQTNWTGTTGSFTNDANWSAGVPTDTVTANINNGGTAQLDTPGQRFIGTFNVAGTAGSTGRFELLGGDLVAGEINIGNVGNGSALIAAGYLEARDGQSVFVGGHNPGNFGTGLLTMTGGFLRSADDFQLGRDGVGTFDFSGGYAEGGFTVVGKFGTGVWNQTGGVFRVRNDLEIGDGGTDAQASTPGPRQGTLTLAGGVIQTNNHFAIGNRSGTGTVIVSGGGLALTGSGNADLYIGRGNNWPLNSGVGGPTSLRIVGDESIVAVARDFVMNLRGVAESSTLIAEITGPTHTPILVRGNANIASGDFRVELTDYAPVLGDSWTILTAGADLFAAVNSIDDLVNAQGPLDLNGDGQLDANDVLTHVTNGAAGALVGQFSQFDTSMASLSAGLDWALDYVGNSVVLSVVEAALLDGDYNADGIVDAADYTVWRDNLGAQVSLPGEAATPGEVTVEDYQVWRGNFGASLGGAAASLSVAAVPEPATFAGLSLAVLIATAAARVRRQV